MLARVLTPRFGPALEAFDDRQLRSSLRPETSMQSADTSL